MRRRARVRDSSESCTASKTSSFSSWSTYRPRRSAERPGRNGNAYRFYFGVYVRRVGRLTPVYIFLIDPFRKLIVYPSLLRSVRRTWNQTFDTGDP